jgi:hypothetical protein
MSSRRLPAPNTTRVPAPTGTRVPAPTGTRKPVAPIITVKPGARQTPSAPSTPRPTPTPTPAPLCQGGVWTPSAQCMCGPFTQTNYGISPDCTPVTRQAVGTCQNCEYYTDGCGNTISGPYCVDC